MVRIQEVMTKFYEVALKSENDFADGLKLPKSLFKWAMKNTYINIIRTK